MKVGTKSVLFGIHCFFIHPFFVAYSWWRLYGFPFDPRLWFSFFLHDIGYIGKSNMDGIEGETHPYIGAKVMGVLFGKKWYEFTLYHSRFLAKKDGKPFSKLCIADKYAIVVTPYWVYSLLGRLSGELNEYLELSKNGKYADANIYDDDLRNYHTKLIKYITAWVSEHKDLKEDTWTKINT